MPLPNPNVLAKSSAATKEFLSYFQNAIDSLAPISELDEDASPSLRMISSKVQVLIQDIIEDMRWFRSENQSSARQVGDVEAQLANIHIQPTTNHAEPWIWHQSLTIDNIRKKVGEASQVYGQEGLDRLLQLQTKIIKLHKEVVFVEQGNINAKLIQQDRDEGRREDRQLFIENVQLPTGGPSDLVSFACSIGDAVIKPFAKMFGHKKEREYIRAIQARQMERQADMATLEVLKVQGDHLHIANLAIDKSRSRLEDFQDGAFNSLAEELEMISISGQINHVSLDFAKTRARETITALQDMDIQLNDKINENVSPQRGLVKSPTVARIEQFHCKTKDVSKHLESLLSISRIILEKHRDHFVKNVVKIAKEFAEIFDSHLKKMFDSWSRYAEKGTKETTFFSLKNDAEAVTRSFIPFDREVQRSIQEISRILEKRYDKSSSKRLQDLQKDGDWTHKGSKWVGRPLATIPEAKEGVQKLVEIINVILKISNEVMPPLLEFGGEGGIRNMPSGERSGREVLQTVPGPLLKKISNTLFVESVQLKDIGNNPLAYA